MQTQPLPLAELAIRYEAGATLAELAPLAGLRTWQALRGRLATHGVSIRSQHKLRREIDTAKLVSAYRAGATVAELMDTTGLSRNAVRNRLVKAGVVFRSESVAREKSLLFASPPEADLIAELHQWGFPCTPQKSFGSRNIDAAYDAAKVAIEIENGPAFAPAHRARLIERTRFLLGEGWCVIFVVCHFRILYWGEVLDRLVPLLDRARDGDRVFGRYGAINRHGQPRDRPRFTLDNLPRLSGF